MDVEKDERQERRAPMEPETPTGCRTGAAGPEVGGGRRALVIATTMRLIAREGVAALSTRKIAREAPINLATMHYLFGGKDELLLTVLDAATSAMIGALVVDVYPGGGLRAALAESVAVLCALLDRVPPLPLVRCEVLLYAGRRPAQHASALQHHQRYLDALQACYRLACAPGELSPIALDGLAAVVSSSIDGLALQVVAGVPLPQQEAIRLHLLRALLALVPAPSGPQARDDGGNVGRLVSVFEETIRSMRRQ
jgi:AcrR family transcriptional regulator